MQLPRNSDLLEHFEARFQEIHDGNMPRPGLFGYSREARQTHKAEVALTYLIRGERRPKFPLPSEPETAYERWLTKVDDDELNTLFGDIYKANPHLFDGGKPLS